MDIQYLTSQDIPATSDGIRTDASGMGPLQGDDIGLRRGLQQAQSEVSEELLRVQNFKRDLSHRYSIFQGSLVGLYHNGGLLPWDDDFDVVMEEADTSRLGNLSKVGAVSEA